MTYQQTIDFLYTQLPMFSRDGAAAFKSDLNNTYALCAVLGNPHEKLKAIHVAGTNGKGSSSHMLAAVMQEAGYKTGLYTSPHLYDFRERIKINGEMCSEDFVVDFVRRIQPHLASIEPSFFEITVAMAFTWFVEEDVDIAVIETGLGGRLDSTNVIYPEISLITNIGYDHMQFLGNSLESIAGEKAGIIKKERPVVISEYLPETRPVFEVAASQQHSPVYFAQDNWKIKVLEEGEDGKISVSAERTTSASGGPDQDVIHYYRLDLTGLYQIRNLAGVLETIKQLRERGWEIPEAAVYDALQQVMGLTGLSGRWEKVLDIPWLITDVGHNVDGIRMIRAQLAVTDYQQLHMITGFVKDKDVAAVLEELPKEARYYFTKAPIPRALDEQELLEKATAAGLQGAAFENMEMALRAAGHAYKEGDLILVCGSVFLVAEVKGALQKAPFDDLAG